jgi:hypothetical protein
MKTSAQIVEAAHRECLSRELEGLGAWCLSRAQGQHDVQTTLTLLERKTARVRERLLRAGWKALAKTSEQQS